MLLGSESRLIGSDAAPHWRPLAMPL